MKRPLSFFLTAALLLAPLSPPRSYFQPIQWLEGN
jgi:hypothetical protein